MSLNIKVWDIFNSATTYASLSSTSLLKSINLVKQISYKSNFAY